MASEIKVNVAVEATKGGLKVSRSVTGKSENQAGAGGGTPGEITVTTSEYDLDLTGYGRVVLENLDTTNFVKWGFATTVYKARLNPNGPATTLYLEAGTHIYFDADTASCQVRVTGFTL